MHQDEYRSDQVLQWQVDDHLLSDPDGLLQRYRVLLGCQDEAKRLAQQLAELTKKHGRLAREHKELTSRTDRLQELYNEMRGQRDTLREQKRAAEKESRTLTRKLQDARTEAADAVDQREQATTRLFETKHELAAERSANEALRERAAALKADLQRVRGSRSMRIGRSVLWPWHATKGLVTGEWPNQRRREEIEAPRAATDDAKGADQ